MTDPRLTMFVEGNLWYWCDQHPNFISDDNEQLGFYFYLVTEWDVTLFSCSTNTGKDGSSSDSTPTNSGHDDDLPDASHPVRPNCEHRNFHAYINLHNESVDKQREHIQSTMYDFNGERIPGTNQTIFHPAFTRNYIGYDDPRNPSLCPDCFSIICHECNTDRDKP